MDTSFWFNEIQQLSLQIRNQPVWRSEPLFTMRNKTTDSLRGAITLYSYSCYVRRFILLMCDVLSKVPQVDSRFWRLADNLHDELGGPNGLESSHGKLIEEAARRPTELSAQCWKRCEEQMAGIEASLFTCITQLPWPLNLFALGPATESISDLFLEPIEHWSAEAVKLRPRISLYFDLHRPEVEMSHQLEIARVLAEELTSMPQSDAGALFDEGVEIAGRVAARHYEATRMCWQISTTEIDVQNSEEF